MKILAGWACEWPLCEDTTNLEVHHRSYECLEHETSDDLVVLCSVHHDVETVRGRYPARSDTCKQIVEARTWRNLSLP